MGFAASRLLEHTYVRGCVCAFDEVFPVQHDVSDANLYSFNVHPLREREHYTQTVLITLNRHATMTTEAEPTRGDHYRRSRHSP